jgi:hypothetical protein
VKHTPPLKQLPTNPTSLLTPNRFLVDIYAPFVFSSPHEITIFFLKSRSSQVTSPVVIARHLAPD